MSISNHPRNLSSIHSLLVTSNMSQLAILINIHRSTCHFEQPPLLIACRSSRSVPFWWTNRKSPQWTVVGSTKLQSQMPSTKSAKKILITCSTSRQLKVLNHSWIPSGDPSANASWCPWRLTTIQQIKNWRISKCTTMTIARSMSPKPVSSRAVRIISPSISALDWPKTSSWSVVWALLIWTAWKQRGLTSKWAWEISTMCSMRKILRIFRSRPTQN